ncbi:MAG: photosystem II S4 domain protein [Eubacteriales bacterium]
MKLLDRKEILERAGTPEDRILMARVLDKTESVKKFHYTAVSEFYDPYQQNLISPVLSKVPGISFVWDGGYPGAERKRLVIHPDYMTAGESDSELMVLSISGNLKFQGLSHRDFLGAVLGLGIKREKVGDIIVNEGGCQVVVDRSIGDYITENLTKVHRVSVKVEKIAPETIEVPAEKVKEIFATVPSLRLDAVAAAGFGVSRTKIASVIAAENVKVNWAVTTNLAHGVKEGDIISIRGRGRTEITSVRGETKKGRISIVLKRYL